MLIAPILMDYLANVFNGQKVLTVNLLHSYEAKDDYLKTFVNDIYSLGIDIDLLETDRGHLNEIIEEIKKMIDVGVIKQSKSKIVIIILP